MRPSNVDTNSPQCGVYQHGRVSEPGDGVFCTSFQGSQVMSEFGEDYLKQSALGYEALKKRLSQVSNAAFNRAKRRASKMELGFESFLADFAIAAEQERRDEERWQTGRSSQASTELTELINQIVPRHVHIHPEALPLCQPKQVLTHSIDVVAEDICCEVRQRLPRALDAYEYNSGYAQDTLDVPGLGLVQVQMAESGSGVFRYVSKISGQGFTIWNCRDSGVVYLDRWIEISRPSEIIIEPLQRTLNIYSDGSGDTHKPCPPAMIKWLAEYVLQPLMKMPKPVNQIQERDPEPPYPAHLGVLYAFINRENRVRTELLREHPERGDVDERYARHPGYRLLSTSTPCGNFPNDLATDCYVWCGMGEAPKDVDYIGKEC